MNNLLFCALLLALLYYFLVYLPRQRKLKEPIIIKPFTSSQTIQTEPITFTNNPLNRDNQSLEKTLDILLQNIRNLNQQIK